MATTSRTPAKKTAAKRAPAKKTTAPRAPRPAAAKQPTDRQAKSTGGFTFTGVDGEEYVLPYVSEGVAGNIPGEISYAAVMDPTNGMNQMRLVFATLEASEPPPAAMAALKALPTDQMMATARRWMGESRGSSS